MEKQRLEDNVNGITAYLGNFNISGSNTINGFMDLEISVKEYLMSVASEDKIASSLKMVLFDKNINNSIHKLSYKDKKKIQLAYALCKKEKTLVFEYFDKGLTLKEKNYFKKLIKRFKEYQFNIIIHTNDVVFLFDLVDHIYIVKNDNIIPLSIVDFYSENLYEYVECPRIVEFVIFCKNNNINLDNYTDNKELIKAIFRMVS